MRSWGIELNNVNSEKKTEAEFKEFEVAVQTWLVEGISIQVSRFVPGLNWNRLLAIQQRG